MSSAEKGEVRQLDDIQTALLDAIQLAFYSAKFEPIPVIDTSDIEDAECKILSGSGRIISGYDIEMGCHVEAGEIYFLSLEDGQEHADRGLYIDWFGGTLLLFDVDFQKYSLDGETWVGSDDPRYKEVYRKAINGLMACIEDI